MKNPTSQCTLAPLSIFQTQVISFSIVAYFSHTSIQEVYDKVWTKSNLNWIGTKADISRSKIMKVWGPGKNIAEQGSKLYTTIIQRKVRTQSILKNCLGNLNDFLCFLGIRAWWHCGSQRTAVSDIPAFRDFPKLCRNTFKSEWY